MSLPGTNHPGVTLPAAEPLPVLMLDPDNVLQYVNVIENWNEHNMSWAVEAMEAAKGTPIGKDGTKTSWKWKHKLTGLPTKYSRSWLENQGKIHYLPNPSNGFKSYELLDKVLLKNHTFGLMYKLEIKPTIYFANKFNRFEKLMFWLVHKQYDEIKKYFIQRGIFPISEKLLYCMRGDYYIDTKGDHVRFDPRKQYLDEDNTLVDIEDPGFQYYNKQEKRIQAFDPSSQYVGGDGNLYRHDYEDEEDRREAEDQFDATNVPVPNVEVDDRGNEYHVSPLGGSQSVSSQSMASLRSNYQPRYQQELRRDQGEIAPRDSFHRGRTAPWSQPSQRSRRGGGRGYMAPNRLSFEGSPGGRMSSDGRPYGGSSIGRGSVGSNGRAVEPRDGRAVPFVQNLEPQSEQEALMERMMEREAQREAEVTKGIYKQQQDVRNDIFKHHASARKERFKMMHSFAEQFWTPSRPRANDEYYDESTPDNQPTRRGPRTTGGQGRYGREHDV